MGERLTAAHVAWLEASQRAAEAEQLLTSRTAWVDALDGNPGGFTAPVLAAARPRAVASAAAAKRALTAARSRRSAALTSLREAQVLYDATREGLFHLRRRYDSLPGPDPALSTRLGAALDAYEALAVRREVRFGPQGPLSRADLPNQPGLCQTLLARDVQAWIKAARGPDPRSGLYHHKVNLRWLDPDRQSGTVDLLSTTPLTRSPGAPEIVGQPTLGDVAARIDAAADAAEDADDASPWMTAHPESTPVQARQRWDAARQMLTLRQHLTA